MGRKDNRRDAFAEGDREIILARLRELNRSEIS